MTSNAANEHAVERHVPVELDGLEGVEHLGEVDGVAAGCDSVAVGQVNVHPLVIDAGHGVVHERVFDVDVETVDENALFR